MKYKYDYIDFDFQLYNERKTKQSRRSHDKKREMKTFPFVPGTRENVYMCTVS